MGEQSGVYGMYDKEWNCPPPIQPWTHRIHEEVASRLQHLLNKETEGKSTSPYQLQTLSSSGRYDHQGI